MNGMRCGVRVILVAASLLGLCVGCGAATPETGKIKVAASIMPLGDFCREVGGDLVDVQVILPPGASEHTYEPSPQQMRFLAEARLLVLNGVGLEYWADKVVGSLANKDLVVVETSAGVPLLDVGTDPESPSGNPHIWFDPTRAAIQVEHIRDALIQVDPTHEAQYRANASAYLDQLKALDAEIAAEVATWAHREFISFHAAYRYYADHYGLVQAAVIEEFPGKEPSAEYIAGVIQTAKSIAARAIFAEPQFSAKAADTIAQATHKSVVLLDPVGGIPSNTTYAELMRYDTRQMATALK
jgi:zinc transport system substrate-binding protein